MIESRKSRVFNWLLRPLMGAILRRRFHNIYLTGAPIALANGPAVGCVNHTNWWDGFVLYWLSHRCLPHEIYLAMEESNLRRYPFFPWMGVFGVDLTGRGRALAGIRYAARLLRQRPDALIWLFVQGALMPPHVPVVAKPGADFLARQTGAALWPVALRYEWLIESRPSIFVAFGAPGEGDLGARLNALLEGMQADVVSGDLSRYKPLFAPRMSLNRKWDWLMHVLLRRPGKFEPGNR